MHIQLVAQPFGQLSQQRFNFRSHDVELDWVCDHFDCDHYWKTTSSENDSFVQSEMTDFHTTFVLQLNWHVDGIKLTGVRFFRYL